MSIWPNLSFGLLGSKSLSLSKGLALIGSFGFTKYLSGMHWVVLEWPLKKIYEPPHRAIFFQGPFGSLFNLA